MDAFAFRFCSLQFTMKNSCTKTPIVSIKQNHQLGMDRQKADSRQTIRSQKFIIPDTELKSAKKWRHIEKQMKNNTSR